MRKSTFTVEKTSSPTSVFVTQALDMSWRLAIVVLVPIIGGFELDKKFNSAPLLMVIGFVLAIGGMALVLWRMLQQVSQLPVSKPEPKGDKRP